MVLKSQVVLPRRDHDWSNSWDVIKPATEKQEGFKVKYCAYGCGTKMEEIIPKLTKEKSDSAAADKKSTSVLILKQKEAKKHSITMCWNKVEGAAYYKLYGSHCNIGDKIIYEKKYLTTTSKTSITRKNLNENEFYKYIVKAYDKDGKQIAQSNIVHIYTTSDHSKISNAIEVKVTTSKITLNTGSTSQIEAVTVVPKGKLKKEHVGIGYISSNQAVVKVSVNGKITAKQKGTAVIYVLAQNGINKKVTVVVK